jgi:hypothetical protein
MEWYHYLAAFWAGAFLGNFVPHFVHGVSGNKFPTPFANPPGIGLSSPTVNVVWALFNLAVGYYLLILSRANNANVFSLITIFAGVCLIGVFASFRFQKKHKD